MMPSSKLSKLHGHGVTVDDRPHTQKTMKPLHPLCETKEREYMRNKKGAWVVAMIVYPEVSSSAIPVSWRLSYRMDRSGGMQAHQQMESGPDQ
jgi:hypothetical protein